MSERNDQNFSEQEAPLKNTDNAFVQVGANGEPQLPSERTQKDIDDHSDKGGVQRQVSDSAKVQDAVSGHGQKMDGIHPDQLQMDANDRAMEARRDEA